MQVYQQQTVTDGHLLGHYRCVCVCTLAIVADNGATSPRQTRDMYMCVLIVFSHTVTWPITHRCTFLFTLMMNPMLPGLLRRGVSRIDLPSFCFPLRASFLAIIIAIAIVSQYSTLSALPFEAFLHYFRQ